ncbi:MAG: hypothetical protein NTX85_03675 [Candidatus Nomurabacteria bacterium]|nr:hypothetical protein [Candidatus Nomurabacteria bacterium]
MNVLVLNHKGEFSIFAREFIKNEKPVILTEEQKFWQKLDDHCLEKVRNAKNLLLIEFSINENCIQKDSSLNDEEKRSSVEFLVGILDKDIIALNETAKEKVKEIAARLHSSYFKKVKHDEMTAQKSHSLMLNFIQQKGGSLYFF